MEDNKYIKGFREAILQAIKDNRDFDHLLDKIYSDGFEDGQNGMTAEDWENIGRANAWL